MKAWQYAALAKKEDGNMTEYEMGEIWIDKVKPDINQPRKNFDKEELKAFAEGIKRQGLINPIEIDEDNMIIDGERRWRACKMIGMTKILYKRKVLKDELKKDEHFKLKRQLQANLTGRNLRIDEAKGAITTLLAAYGVGKGGDPHKEEGISKLARELGITRPYLSQILHLAKEGSDGLKQAVEKKEIPVSTAYEISKIENPKVQDEVVEYAGSGEGELTRDETRKLVKELKDALPEEAHEIIEAHKVAEPLAAEVAEGITKAFEQIDKEQEKFKDNGEYANYLFLKVVQGAFEAGKIFCPYCKKQHGLEWACCKHSLSDSIKKLSKRTG